MGVFDEFKSEGMKTLAMLGMIFGFVLLYFLWSISIWAVLAPFILAGVGFLVFKFWRGGGL